MKPIALTLALLIASTAGALLAVEFQLRVLPTTDRTGPGERRVLPERRASERGRPRVHSRAADLGSADVGFSARGLPREPARVTIRLRGAAPPVVLGLAIMPAPTALVSGYSGTSWGNSARSNRAVA